MKNREKYDEFLTECLTKADRFGVNKVTNEPCVCRHLACLDCKFHDLGKSCTDFRKDWLDQEVDKWSEFRDLKRGDIIMVNVRAFWFPHIFVNIDDLGLHYTSCVDKNGDFLTSIQFEDDPRRVKKCLRREYYEE